MKIIQGIVGAFLGTFAALSVISLLVYGNVANLEFLLLTSLFLGLINGIIIAVVSFQDEHPPTYLGHGLYGAVGMAMIFIVLLVFLIFFATPIFAIPSLSQFVIHLIVMMGIGALSGVCSRALSSLG